MYIKIESNSECARDESLAAIMSVAIATSNLIFKIVHATSPCQILFVVLFFTQFLSKNKQIPN